MARNLFRAARQDIGAVRRAKRQRLEEGFTVTQSRLAAITANLGTAGASARANLTATQARELAAISRIARRGTRQAARGVQRAQEQGVTRFGTALGPTVESALGPARATAAATRGIARGQEAAGAILAEGGQFALQTQLAGAAEAASAADYALAVALQQRGQADASQIAEMQFTLSQMRLDHRFAMQEARTTAALNWRYRELEIEKLRDIEQGTAEEGTFALMSNASSVAANSFMGLQQAFNTRITDPTSGEQRFPTAGEAAQQYIAQNDIIDPAAQLLIRNIASSMWRAGAGPTNLGQDPLGAGGLYGEGASDIERAELIRDAIAEGLISQYPQYADRIDDIQAFIKADVGNQITQQAWRRAQEESQGDGGLSFFDRFRAALWPPNWFRDVVDPRNPEDDYIPSVTETVGVLTFLGGGVGGPLSAAAGGTATTVGLGGATVRALVTRLATTSLGKRALITRLVNTLRISEVKAASLADEILALREAAKGGFR